MYDLVLCLGDIKKISQYTYHVNINSSMGEPLKTYSNRLQRMTRSITSRPITREITAKKILQV